VCFSDRSEVEVQSTSSVIVCNFCSSCNVCCIFVLCFLYESLVVTGTDWHTFLVANVSFWPHDRSLSDAWFQNFETITVITTPLCVYFIY